MSDDRRWRGPEGLLEQLEPVGDLTPYPGNPRQGDIGAICVSLQQNGQYRPIVVSSDGYILAGNHTWQAAVQLGWTDIAVTRVPVAHDSPEGQRIVLVDNRTADLATNDDAALAAMLVALADDDAANLLGTGYDGDDLDRLLADLEDGPLPPEDAGDQSGQLHARYCVIVDCPDEQAQRRLLETLTDEGWTCRAIVS